jgi:hypothetical protein
MPYLNLIIPFEHSSEPICRGTCWGCVVEGCGVRLEEAQRELALVGDEPAAAAGEPVAG